MKQAYNDLMPRNLSKPRPPQGERLLKLRQEAGISQRELAKLIGEPQQNVAFWEQSDKPPKSDAVPKLAKILGVRIEDLFALTDDIPRKNGPTGRLKTLFESVAKLPRRQQDKVMEFITAFVSHYQQTKETPQVV